MKNDNSKKKRKIANQLATHNITLLLFNLGDLK